MGFSVKPEAEHPCHVAIFNSSEDLKFNRPKEPSDGSIGFRTGHAFAFFCSSRRDTQATAPLRLGRILEVRCEPSGDHPKTTPNRSSVSKDTPWQGKMKSSSPSAKWFVVAQAVIESDETLTDAIKATGKMPKSLACDLRKELHASGSRVSMERHCRGVHLCHIPHTQIGSVKIQVE
jgi:hypothetical protein